MTATSTRLPYKKMRVKYLDFDHNPKYNELKGIHGICNVGKNQDEIWINKNKLLHPADTMELTRVHEFVHIRRQEAGEVYKNWRKEEDTVELEAISRCSSKSLNQAQRLMKIFLTNDYKNGQRTKLYPDKPEDLKKIHAKIKQILLPKYGK